MKDFGLGLGFRDDGRTFWPKSLRKSSYAHGSLKVLAVAGINIFYRSRNIISTAILAGVMCA